MMGVTKSKWWRDSYFVYHLLISRQANGNDFVGGTGRRQNTFAKASQLWPEHIVYANCNVKCMGLARRYTCEMEKVMATHSSTLAWKIPWTEEPGRLKSMGSLRVGRDWVTSLSLFTFMHWRKKWQPTPVFLPGESQGRGSLVGCRLWGHTESDRTEAT